MAGVMPHIGLGTLGITEAAAVSSALTMGYRLLDCAPSYRNEDTVGNGIRLSRIPRGDIWITSKLWPGYYRDVRRCMRGTLKSLKVDYVDLYLLHWPFALKHAEFGSKVADWQLDFVPMHEVWAQMEALQKEGLARYIGVANWTAGMMNDLLSYATVRPFVNQIELHPYNAQRDLVEYCGRQGVICQAYGPLGPLGHRKTSHLPALLKNPVILDIASSQSLAPSQVLLSWGLSRGTSVVVKSSSVSHQRLNLAAGQVRLPEEVLSRIDDLDEGYRYYDYAIKKGIPSFA